MRRKIKYSILALAAFLLLATIVYAWTPPGNIDLRDYYNLTNAPFLNATQINVTELHATGTSYFHGQTIQQTGDIRMEIPRRLVSCTFSPITCYSLLYLEDDDSVHLENAKIGQYLVLEADGSFSFENTTGQETLEILESGDVNLQGTLNFTGQTFLINQSGVPIVSCSDADCDKVYISTENTSTADLYITRGTGTELFDDFIVYAANANFVGDLTTDLEFQADGNITTLQYYVGNGSALTDVPAYNATYESTFNSTYDTYVTANYTNNSNLLDGYDSAYFYGLNKTMNNATIFGDNDKTYFGTDYDVYMTFNGTHLVIKSA